MSARRSSSTVAKGWTHSRFSFRVRIKRSAQPLPSGSRTKAGELATPRKRISARKWWLIPGSRSADRWREPRKVGERAEASRLGEERVPGRAGRVHHGLVAAGEHPVAEPAVAQVLPHP